MPIPTDKAADIARAAGLTLTDAQALAVLADDDEHAQALAARFAPAERDPDPDQLADRILGGGR